MTRQDSMFSPVVELVDVRPAYNAGNLKAFLTIKVGEVTICDCRVVQQPGQKAYISGPHKQEGQVFFPLVKMSPALRQRVEETIIPQLRERKLIDLTDGQ